MLDIPPNSNARYIHYPNKIIKKSDYYEYEITKKINPKYPIYIISKGRWGLKNGTAQVLDEMGCPYKIVVEPEEYNNYAEVIDKKNTLGGNPEVDITKIIVEKLNKELPSLNLK